MRKTMRVLAGLLAVAPAVGQVQEGIDYPGRFHEVIYGDIHVGDSFTVADSGAAGGNPVRGAVNGFRVNADGVAITPDIGSAAGATTGSVTVTPAATTTYALSATNAVGTATATVRVGIGPPRPNILFFLVDDMGWQDCSVPFHFTNGVPVRTALNGTYRTPNLESLAARGLRFGNACAHPVCSPSRVSLMTGMTAARHRVTNWTFPTEPRQVDSANATLDPPADWRMGGMDEADLPFPRLLQQAGYRTIHSGKAHFGPNFRAGGVVPNPSGDPCQLGFDVNIAGHGAGGPGSYASESEYGTAALWHVPGLEHYYTPVQTHTHLTEALTREINQTIAQAVADDTPFYAYMSHYAIHSPYEIDGRFSANYPDLTGTLLGHATLIEGIDKSLGDILRNLDELGVAEDTLVVFMGDNGAETPSTRLLPRPSDPLRGRKGTPYEGGCRVPLLVSWAKSNPSNPFQARLPVPADAWQGDIVTVEDVYPTLLEVAGVSCPNAPDGHSLVPYLQGRPGPHRPQEFIMHFPHDHNDDFFSTLRQGDWKVIWRYLDQTWEMYDLVADMGEANNLARDPTPENAAHLVRLARRLVRELNRYGAQFPTQDADGAVRGILMPAPVRCDTDGDGLPDAQEDVDWDGLVDAGESDPDHPDAARDATPDRASIRASLGTGLRAIFFAQIPGLKAGATIPGPFGAAGGATEGSVPRRRPVMWFEVMRA